MLLAATPPHPPSRACARTAPVISPPKPRSLARFDEVTYEVRGDECEPRADVVESHKGRRTALRADHLRLGRRRGWRRWWWEGRGGGRAARGHRDDDVGSVTNDEEARTRCKHTVGRKEASESHRSGATARQRNSARAAHLAAARGVDRRQSHAACLSAWGAWGVREQPLLRRGLEGSWIPGRGTLANYLGPRLGCGDSLA